MTRSGQPEWQTDGNQNRELKHRPSARNSSKISTKSTSNTRRIAEEPPARRADRL
jgi:hypothetical protein